MVKSENLHMKLWMNASSCRAVEEEKIQKKNKNDQECSYLCVLDKQIIL